MRTIAAAAVAFLAGYAAGTRCDTPTCPCQPDQHRSAT